MDNLAKQLSGHAAQETGTIVRAEAGGFVVRTNGGDYRATRATSCLVEPEPGDFTLVTVLPTGRCYVLAILEREDNRATRLTAEGDLDVTLPNGRFRVAAQEGVDLLSGKDVAIAAGEVSLHATRGRVVIDTLSLLGSAVVAEVSRVKVLAGALDTVVDRVTQRVKRSYRFVEEIEALRATRIDYVAKKSVSVRGENALITAEELVKVDGEQIHVG